MKKISVILFDLDGTLLPMDNDLFTKTYFKYLAKKLAPHGYEPEKLVDSIWAGTAKMVTNDGSCTNDKAFWKKFSEIYGEKGIEDMPLFDEFYQTDFSNAKSVCGFDENAVLAVKRAKELGFRVALATNPIFPELATRQRIQWAGLDINDFELCTTYENIGYCKPNPDYYLEVAKKLQVAPEQCLMVGNDVGEDMIAETVGMEVFLLTDNIINKKEKDISSYKQGGFLKLINHLESIAG